MRCEQLTLLTSLVCLLLLPCACTGPDVLSAVASVCLSSRTHDPPQLSILLCCRYGTQNTPSHPTQVAVLRV